jgi:hypothetical protein
MLEELVGLVGLEGLVGLPSGEQLEYVRLKTSRYPAASTPTYT